jgi:predicted ABC-type ATPase
MNELLPAVMRVVELQKESKKPLAIVLAGHNGSGKSTMWYGHLSSVLKIPLINADRMMRRVDNVGPCADGSHATTPGRRYTRCTR